ncbi:SPOR domain-containing protein [Parabacteroides sp. Marseille-P3160]|uniref:SPOR domain-containing protein n=1 Tax=Parabacteroides sp. Marseille-P3160 TaxID=1917887 RepID=UPI0009BABD84|nr:SPOR domain-containing protein [Parabacteroides sp. Marseille-P3160]
MRKSYFLLLSFAFSVTSLFAQSNSTIIDDLQRSEPGKGEVSIHQSEAIRNLVGTRMKGDKIERIKGRDYLLAQGYRTQVYSGNDPRGSKAEAFSRERHIQEAFPGVPTYVTYVAPFWRLRVGDCATREEAFHLMQQIISIFPSYGKEMYIVKENIQIPLD